MFDVDFDVLVTAFESEDEVGTVLRTHLVFEKFLDWTFDHFVTGELKTCVQRPTNFRGKVSMAAALGLPVALATAVNQLNNVRNDLAHRMEKINSSQTQQFGRDVDKLASLHPGFRPLAQRTVEFQFKNPGVIHKYGSGNARLDFVIASMAMLTVAVAWSAKAELKIPVQS